MIGQTFLQYLSDLGIGAAAPPRANDAPAAEDAPVRLAFAAPTLAAASEPIREVGTPENDVIRGGGESDTFIGGAGNDTLIGRGGNDTLNGGLGDDRMVGGGGRDRLLGARGDDVMIGGGGRDTLIGGGGDDRIKGGGGKDSIIGGGGADLLQGNGGADIIKGGGGADTLVGGPGLDTLIGGGGRDVMVFSDGDLARSAITEIRNFRLGADRVDLSAVASATSFESLDFEAAAGGVNLRIGGSVIFFAGLSAEGFDAFDFIFAGGGGGGAGGGGGGVGADPFTGGAGADTLAGSSGADLIRGLGGDDVIGTSAGLDTLEGGGGSDLFVIRLEGGNFDGNVDVVSDFTRNFATGELDRISLTEALSGVQYDDLADVVQVVNSGGDTIIQIRRSTADGTPFQNALVLEDATFTFDDLKDYGFKLQPIGVDFNDNPYGFANNQFATADPIATQDGDFVAFVDQQNLDGNAFDQTPSRQTNENSLTRDVFIMNTGTGEIQRVSTKTDANKFTEAVSPALSADGRFVAYVQEAPGSSSGNVFVRDMAQPDLAPVQVDITTGGAAGGAGTRLINQTNGGLAGSRANESVGVVDISGDGSKVVFVTRTALSGADSNGGDDVYLRDLSAGTTTLISQIGGVAVGGGLSGVDAVKISEDGRYVAFSSLAEFVGGEDPGASGVQDNGDIYLFDTQTGQYLRVSSPVAGAVGNFDMSADGSRIVFGTEEAISANDTNGLSDIYVADIDLASFSLIKTQRVSEADGRFELFDADSYAPTISHDGERIAFLSQARDIANLGQLVDVNGDDNGEFLFLLDLETGALTTPTIPSAQGNQQSLNIHASLTDDSFVYRIETTAAPDGRRSISDTITFGQDGAIPESEISDSFGGAFRLEDFGSFRSEIDTAGDVDFFFIPTSSSEQNRQRSISVEGVDSNGGTLSDPKVTLFTSSGSPLSSVDPATGADFDDGFGRDDFVDYRTPNGSVFIRVESENGGTGSYRIVIDDLDDPSDLTATPAADPFIF